MALLVATRPVAGAETVVVGGDAPRDSAAARSAPAKTPLFEQPRFVMLRSAVIPGWGQLHNGSWLKALAVAGAEVWLGLQLVEDRQELDDLLEQIEVADDSSDTDLEDALITTYNERLDQFTARQWLFGAVVVYAMLDAYVDAHFKNVDIDFDADPALPAGERRFRIGWRTTF